MLSTALLNLRMNNMLDHETLQVIKKWDEEINTEMRKFINNGVPPYEAAEKARLIVSTRRSNNNMMKMYNKQLTRMVAY